MLIDYRGCNREPSATPQASIGYLVAAEPAYYRSIWISDFHLGTVRCQAPELIDFLRHHQAATLYLAGDVIDGWNLGPAWYWNAAQTAVVEELARWRRAGTRVVFLPGNHDECNADMVQTLLGPVESATELIHRTAAGRRMLVTHGHQFDGSFNPSGWAAIMGGLTYSAGLRINLWYNRERARGPVFPACLRKRIRHTIHSLLDFNNRRVSEIVRRHRADGVICGHTHNPGVHETGSLLYVNDGDWVQNRTALVEEMDGSLRLLRWRKAGDISIPKPIRPLREVA